MSKSNAWENAYLLLLFNNVDATGIGDAGGLLGSVVDGDLFISLHTADPGEGGDQTTNEIAYTDYDRVAVPRDVTGFTVTNNSVAFADIVSFPIGGGGSGTATFFGIGTDASGAGLLLYSGTVTPNIVCGLGVTPQLSTAADLVTES